MSAEIDEVIGFCRRHLSFLVEEALVWALDLGTVTEASLKIDTDRYILYASTRTCLILASSFFSQRF